MTSTKYIRMDVYKESISIQVMNSVGQGGDGIRHRDQGKHHLAVH